MQSSTAPVAVIDVGSNSIKLLVAKAGNSSDSIETVFAETIETRISAGISRELPSLTEEAMDAGLKTIQDLVHLAHDYQPSAIRIVATSAVRDAINGMDFIESVTQTTGIPMQVLSGTEEATLIGKGLACDPQIAGVHRFLQMDLGG
ncbi:MAG: Ppx/GppA phosphatase family protein, partial [Coraliomargarita sp.]